MTSGLSSAKTSKTCMTRTWFGSQSDRNREITMQQPEVKQLTVVVERPRANAHSSLAGCYLAPRVGIHDERQAD